MLSGPGRNDGRVQPKTRVVGTFRERAGHMGPRFIKPTSGSQRPCERVVSENILSLLKLLLRKAHCQLRLFAAGRQIERERARVSGGTVAAQARFDLDSFLLS